MAYTVKQLLESKQFPDMRLVTCKENLNQEIKGIRIIEIEDMERYLTGGELLPYKYESVFRRNGERVSETFE
ncbi:MAG: hypothetical protein ACLUJR_11655 [Mediterraneibacter gnavus]